MKRNIPFILTILFFITGISSGKGQHIDKHSYPDSLISSRLATVIITESAFYLGGLYYLNNIWYKDHQSVPFHFYNDNRGWMQIDKAGHMYTSYYEGYSGMRALQRAGLSRNKAIWYGGTLGLVLQTPIEIFDGIYEGYGFSTGDMIANAAGTSLLIGQELLWNEQRITMKFSYSSTQYPEYRPSYFGTSTFEKFVTDYNGHTYWLSANLSSFAPAANLPKWLNLALGIGADGMLAEFENPEFYHGEPLPKFERTRQLYFSIDIDLRKIQVRNKFLREILFNLNRLKFPAPTLEYNSSKGFVFHPVYF